MRGLLIVNPLATSIPGDGADLVIGSLDGLVSLTVARTEYRDHARVLGAAAAGYDAVIVFGGDGVINEAVNGLMSLPSAARPVLAVLPGGGGNVFAQGLGLPATAAAALQVIRDLLAARSWRTIGLGLAGDRYFTFSAGLGMDAEVVREVESLRLRGRRESPSLFMRAIVRRYYRGTDRRRPALTVERAGQPAVDGLFMGVVTNSAPWTYFRRWPLLPYPGPSFDAGLDLLALSRLRMPVILGTIARLMRTAARGTPPKGRHLLTAHGLDTVTIRCSRPTAFHVDGEYLGETESVKFQFVPDALRVAAPSALPTAASCGAASCAGNVTNTTAAGGADRCAGGVEVGNGGRTIGVNAE